MAIGSFMPSEEIYTCKRQENSMSDQIMLQVFHMLISCQTLCIGSILSPKGNFIVSVDNR